jgi:hypothetical protein
MLNMDKGDYIQSLTLRSRADWDSGARKTACPDGLRLIGISSGSTRALCTDAVLGTSLWASDHPTTVVKDQKCVLKDWAPGYTKYQCPLNSYVLGYSIKDAKISSVLCAKASTRPIIDLPMLVAILMLGRIKAPARQVNILQELPLEAVELLQVSFVASELFAVYLSYIQSYLSTI